MDITETINIEELKKHQQELNKWENYIPLILIGFIDDDYFNRMNNDAKIKYKKTRQGLPGELPANDEYLIQDLLDWVKDYPQFKNIIK